MKYLKIFTDFLDALAPLSDGAAGRLFRAMLAYARDGSVPTLKGKEAVLWIVAQQHMDREAAAYEGKVEARREAGRRGAEARWQKTANHGKDSQDNDKEKDNDNDKNKDNDFFSSGRSRLTAEKKETHPTLEEVLAFSEETGLPADPQLFFDYYEANGWHIGRLPMKDWKAAFRAWARNAPAQRSAPAREPSVGDNFKKAMELLRMEEAKQV